MKRKSRLALILTLILFGSSIAPAHASSPSIAGIQFSWSDAWIFPETNGDIFPITWTNVSADRFTSIRFSLRYANNNREWGFNGFFAPEKGKSGFWDLQIAPSKLINGLGRYLMVITIDDYLGSPIQEKFNITFKPNESILAKAAADALAKVQTLLTKCDELNVASIEYRNQIDINIVKYPSNPVFAALKASIPKPLVCSRYTDILFPNELYWQGDRLNNIYLGNIAAAKVEDKKMSQLVSKMTIICKKGKNTKRVTSVNPKCPAGYVKR